MDLNFIAAWGEFLGGIAGVIAAFGIIITLLFLSRQIRQNTDQISSQVAHGLMSELRHQGDAVKQSLTTAELYIRGLKGLSELSSEGERFQFNAINVGFFRVFEEAFLHYQAGRLEEEYWKSLSGQFERVLQIPGIREDWTTMIDNFDPSFCKYAATLGKLDEQS
jgi:hypothetical protein